MTRFFIGIQEHRKPGHRSEEGTIVVDVERVPRETDPDFDPCADYLGVEAGGFIARAEVDPDSWPQLDMNCYGVGGFKEALKEARIVAGFRGRKVLTDPDAPWRDFVPAGYSPAG